MVNKSSDIVIVGGGHASAQLIDSLRRKGFTKSITLIGEEPYFPYQRPPLSKHYLEGRYNHDWLYYRPENFYRMNNVETILGKRVVKIDRQVQAVTLENNETIAYSKLALTTGTRLRKLTVPGSDLSGVCYLRSLKDADEIREQLSHVKEVVIIGGGFIGLEIAAILVRLNKKVTVLEMQDQVMSRAVGPIISDYYRNLHTQNGVRIFTGTQVSEIQGNNNRVTKVVCSDGKSYPAELVIVGIGVLPNIELAQEANLDCDNGIIVDEYATTSDSNIVAAGDCACHPNSLLGRHLRLETVHNAVEQARTAAATLCGKKEAYKQIPWVWTDQYDYRLQMVGLSDGYDDIIVRGNTHSRKFSAFYYKSERLLAVHSVNRPLEFSACRKLLNNEIHLSKKQAADVSFNLKVHAGNLNHDLVFDPPWVSKRKQFQAV